MRIGYCSPHFAQEQTEGMWSPKVTLQVKEKLDGEPDLLTPFRAPQFFFTGVPWFQMPVRPAPAGLFFFPEPPFRVGGGKALLLPPQRESRDEQTLTASSGLCPGPCAPHCPPVPFLSLLLIHLPLADPSLCFKCRHHLLQEAVSPDTPTAPARVLLRAPLFWRC